MPEVGHGCGCLTLRRAAGGRRAGGRPEGSRRRAAGGGRWVAGGVEAMQAKTPSSSCGKMCAPQVWGRCKLRAADGDGKGGVKTGSSSETPLLKTL